jgi:hypothetical protein
LKTSPLSKLLSGNRGIQSKSSTGQLCILHLLATHMSPCFVARKRSQAFGGLIWRFLGPTCHSFIPEQHREEICLSAQERNGTFFAGTGQSNTAAANGTSILSFKLYQSTRFVLDSVRLIFDLLERTIQQVFPVTYHPTSGVVYGQNPVAVMERLTSSPVRDSSATINVRDGTSQEDVEDILILYLMLSVQGQFYPNIVPRVTTGGFMRSHRY